MHSSQHFDTTQEAADYFLFNIHIDRVSVDYVGVTRTASHGLIPFWSTSWWRAE